MHETNTEEKRLSTSVWVVVWLCTVVVVAALSFGAAYAAIQSARITAAKASVGQIETTFRLAELQAQEEGLAPPDGTFENLLKSYESGETASLTAYEKYVLEVMLETFGPGRNFDFAVTKYQDSAGVHTYIYYFPKRGQTNMQSDRYYVAVDGNFQEKNG